MSIRHIALAAAVAAAFIATPASASSFASASMSQFSYTLFDLNPTDGMAPAVSFALVNSIYGSYVQSSATDPAGGTQSNTAWSLQPFGPATASAGIGLGSAQAAVSGSPTAGGMSFTASGAALGSNVPNVATQFSASAAAANFSALNFTLSPYTLIVFSGTANLLAQTTVGRNDVGFQNESATASVSIGVTGPSSTGNSGFQNTNDTRSLSASFLSVFNPTTGQFSYTGQTQTLNNAAMSASFTNFTTANLTGQMSLSVGVNGNSPLTPIPEPSSAALLLGGLFAVGAWARRHRRV